MSILEEIASSGLRSNNAVRGYVRYLIAKAQISGGIVEFSPGREEGTLHIGRFQVPMRAFARRVEKQGTEYFEWLNTRIPEVLWDHGLIPDEIEADTPFGLEAAITILGSPITVCLNKTYYAGFISLPVNSAQFQALAASVTHPTDPYPLATLVEESFYLSRDAYLFYQTLGSDLHSLAARGTIKALQAIGTFDGEFFHWAKGPLREDIRDYGYSHCIPAFMAEDIPQTQAIAMCIIEAALTVTRKNFFVVDQGIAYIGNLDLPQVTTAIINGVTAQEAPEFINKEQAISRYKARRS
ncbi:MAG: hypothetical protein Q3972_02510 [Corynebacterium sp.]|nr:hypothetical protein [Corynebacterium sp.]